jgi:hypothetical protein
MTMIAGSYIRDWPVYGMYQPDSIDFVQWNGQNIIITANEGDAQEYSAPANFVEEIRGKDINRTLAKYYSFSFTCPCFVNHPLL